MTVIKIIFILLLLIPIAVLMRYFLGRLSMETPAQTDSREPIEKQKPADNDLSAHPADAPGTRTRRAKRKKTRRDRKNRAGDDMDAVDQRSGRGSRSERTSIGDVHTEGSTDGSSGYTPRQPEQWQRSERIPFGEAEGYRVEPSVNKRPIAENPSYKQWKKPSDAVRERAEEEALKARSRSGTRESEEDIAFADPKSGDAGGKTKSDKKKKNRSEKSPTKRQLRRNRERARKRDLMRRKKERETREKSQK